MFKLRINQNTRVENKIIVDSKINTKINFTGS